MALVSAVPFAVFAAVASHRVLNAGLEVPGRLIALAGDAPASPSPAKRRVLIPDRLWIHLSEESRTSQILSLVTTRSGR